MSATPQFDARVAIDEDEGFAGYKAVEHYDFRSQVKDVARELSYDLPDFTYTLEWEESMMDDCGVISAIEVGVFDANAHIYLMRRLEIDDATTNRAATGKDQAYAIRDALVAEYDAVRAFVRRSKLAAPTA